MPAGFPAQDYGDLLAHTKAANMGVINIRVLAGGALSGSEERHALASPPPDPIGSGSNYRIDVERARRFMPLVHEGHADSLVEAALRYVIAHEAISTVLIGIATIEQFEIAARSINKWARYRRARWRASPRSRARSPVRCGNYTLSAELIAVGKISRIE